jgi:alpha-ketoglutarate-dependent taurine dioxygenase
MQSLLRSARTPGRASRLGVASRGLSSSRLLEGRYTLNDRPDSRPGLGAVLPAVDLTDDFSEEDMQVIRQASHDAGGILVFPNQRKLDTPKQIAFARKFGIIEPHSVAKSTVSDCPECLEIIREPSAKVVFGENWHSDNSFLEQTCSFSILRGTEVMPKRGSNDTLFSSTEAAFEALSPTMQNLLYGLRAYHSAGKAYGVKTGRDSNTRAAMEATGKMRFNDHAPILKRDYLHPVITVHPDTGRKAIFVSQSPPRPSAPLLARTPPLLARTPALRPSLCPAPSALAAPLHPRNARSILSAPRSPISPALCLTQVSPTFTTRIEGLHPDESKHLLDFLCKHITQPQFCARVSWSKYQVTMWDNRSLSHKGVADDVSERRIVHRVSLRGTRPRSVFDVAEPKEVPYEEVDYSGPPVPARPIDIQIPTLATEQPQQQLQAAAQ